MNTLGDIPKDNLTVLFFATGMGIALIDFRIFSPFSDGWPILRIASVSIALLCLLLCSYRELGAILTTCWEQKQKGRHMKIIMPSSR